MFIETVKDEGIAHLSYLVGDGNEAVVIDPRRDCDIYVELARQRGAEIVAVLETHRNEDYVIGSSELEARLSIPVYHGAALDFAYGQPLSQGEEVRAGRLRFRCLETPGHTPESLSFALFDDSTGDSPLGVFTGDALFVSDVGRTDLTPDDREAAEQLYASIFEKLLTLGDEVVLYPAHGAGSVCGSGMADRDFSTLGYERRHNPMLQLDRESFVKRKMAEVHGVPPYFREMEHLNEKGAPRLMTLPELPGLDDTAFAEAMKTDALVVDTRSAAAYAGASIPGSIALPLPLLGAYAGWLLPYRHPILLVSEDRAEAEEAVRTLVRLGYEQLRGMLQGGIMSWLTSGRSYDQVPPVDAKTLSGRAREGFPGSRLVDVRKQEEFDAERLPGSVHMYLGSLVQRMEELPKDVTLTTFCGSGQRATVAASLLKRGGFRNLEVALGSMQACKSVGCPTES
jgi:hydroxyacylglutathione hydrolase